MGSGRAAGARLATGAARRRPADANTPPVQSSCAPPPPSTRVVAGAQCLCAPARLQSKKRKQSASTRTDEQATWPHLIDGRWPRAQASRNQLAPLIRARCLALPVSLIRAHESGETNHKVCARPCQMKASGRLFGGQKDWRDAGAQIGAQCKLLTSSSRSSSPRPPTSAPVIRYHSICIGATISRPRSPVSARVCRPGSAPAQRVAQLASSLAPAAGRRRSGPGPPLLAPLNQRILD